MILQLQQISKNFGGVQAISEVDFAVKKGEIFGLIGPNGAGKTTLLNIITGAYLPTSGEVLLNGQRITAAKQLARVRAGITRTFQNIRLFTSMSVLENVLIAQRPAYSLLEAFLHAGRFGREEQRARAQALELLEFLGIAHLADANAAQLSYGQQRKLEIARALALRPQLLLLDEPAAGMNESESDELARIIEDIRAGRLPECAKPAPETAAAEPAPSENPVFSQKPPAPSENPLFSQKPAAEPTPETAAATAGQNPFAISILLIEHDMKFIKRLCDRVLVLDYGRTICCAAPELALKNPEVIRAYLGEIDA